MAFLEETPQFCINRTKHCQYCHVNSSTLFPPLFTILFESLFIIVLLLILAKYSPAFDGKLTVRTCYWQNYGVSSTKAINEELRLKLSLCYNQRNAVTRMVYFITGSNVFGQWLCEDAVISEYRHFTATKHDLGIDLKQANLVQINWSYNIFKVNSVFYITGAWDGKEHQLVKIPIPEESSGSNAELSVIGNDYKILLIGKNVNKLWVIDLKTSKIKKIQVHVEEPYDHDMVKKQKKENSIIKAGISNESCIFLTSNGSVYCGLLPSYVDTSHCKGKVIDVKCGYEHFIILTEYGRVYSWGNGRRLQLGHGDITSQELPTEIDALAGIKIIKISAGGWHSLALSEFGDLYAWGWNDTGQLGIKSISKESYSIPTLIDLFDEWDTNVEKNTKDIACGSRHSAIVLEDNTVWTTGCNKYGQLGLSEEKYPTLNHFKKAYNCDTDCSLMCGPWNTVIYSSQTTT